MPAMGNVNNEQNIGNKSHGEDNHDLFCVTEKDLDLIDIDELF